MASQTLRPHRSPSPSPTPTTPVNPSNPAKLMRQSLGPPPTSSSGSARGFSGLGVAAGGATGSAQPRHVSSSVALGMGSSARDSLSPKPGFNNHGTPRAASTYIGRPSSEFLLGGHARDAKTPESEQIDQWFQHLADWEHTLEEMAAASTDQNFTEELGAIEQWFRVLSEAERTAALYSLLQHSTPVQIRFFVNVLQHMSQSDPMTALLSPVAPQQSMQAAMESRLASMNLKSPSAGGGAGFPGSPVANLPASDAAAAAANKSKLRQNRISAPGTLQPSDRWQGQLDQVAERGMSPGIDDTTSNRSRSPAVDSRPKSADFSGQAAEQASGRSPRQASGLGLGLPQPDVSSPITSPFLNGSWASMSSTPLVPMFTDPKIDTIGATLNMANLQLGQAPATRVALDDPRKYRRAGAVPGAGAGRNVSGSYNDDGDVTPSGQPGRATSPLAGGLGMQNWSRSPLLDQYGLGGLGIGGTDQATLAGLGMNMANLNMMGGMNANQMLALAQAQQQLSTAASFAHAGYGGQGGLGMPRMGQGRPSAGRRSPMLGNRGSPTPDRMNASAAAGAGGGAGGGAGVAGPDDVDERVLADTSGWLRVLRLHKYTTNFASSSWKQMANMTDQDLLDKGVSAQGARTKFLKVFYNVRTHFNMPHPEGSEEYAPGENKEEETK